MRGPVGTWRSLVAYLNGVQGVPGSNPGVPTKSLSLISAPRDASDAAFPRASRVLDAVAFESAATRTAARPNEAFRTRDRASGTRTPVAFLAPSRDRLARQALGGVRVGGEAHEQNGDRRRIAVVLIENNESRRAREAASERHEFQDFLKRVLSRRISPRSS